jgi:hypothetical protein
MQTIPRPAATESSATEVRHGGRIHYDLAVPLLDERTLPRVPDAIGDHAHRRLQIQFFPLCGVRSAIIYARLTLIEGKQFETIGHLWAKPRK